MNYKFNNLQISSLTAVVPRRKLDLSTLVSDFELGDIERTIAATGVKEVRLTKPGETAADLCFHAANRIFQESNHRPEEIDGLIFVSSTPDYICNATGPILQHRLGLKKSIPSFDINYGCSGYVYGLFQAAMMISSGAGKKILLLVGETPAKSVQSNDRATRFLFGDAGSATIIESGSDSWSFHIGTDGSGYEHIFIPGLGFRNPDGERTLRMNGPEVMSFVTQTGPAGVEALLDTAGLASSDIDRWYFHQANKMIIDYLQKKLKLDQDRVVRILAQFGNTGGTSIPLAIADFLGQNFGKDEEKSVLAGFGVGLSWAFVNLKLKQDKILMWSEV